MAQGLETVAAKADITPSTLPQQHTSMHDFHDIGVVYLMSPFDDVRVYLELSDLAAIICITEHAPK